MKTLTKREKMLLYILIYVLIIIVGGLFICLPTIEKHTELKSQYETVDAELASTKASIVEYKDLDKKIEDATAEYTKQIENFYIAEATKTEDVDQLITKMAVAHGLKPTSLQINEIVTEDIISFDNFKTNLSKTENSSNSDSKEENGKKIKVYNVTLNVTGSVKNLQSLVNDANTNKTLKISGLTYSTQASNAKAMTVVFKIYMI